MVACEITRASLSGPPKYNSAEHNSDGNGCITNLFRKCRNQPAMQFIDVHLGRQSCGGRMAGGANVVCLLQRRNPPLAAWKAKKMPAAWLTLRVWTWPVGGRGGAGAILIKCARHPS